MEKHITIGVAGHVDHGKTSLVRRLTGIDTDRLEEEKRRGLSIEAGIAPLDLSSDMQIALVDVPGHTDYLKNTIRGLSSVDMAILVVAADDGVMPQTEEHIEILKFFRAKTGFIVLSKSDLVDQETLELAELEITEKVVGTFLEGKPIIPYSALDSKGIDEIRSLIRRECEKLPEKDANAPFRLWVDQVKSIPGSGTVVSGTILSGKVSEDDALLLMPSGIETRARSLEVHHRKASQAFAGQRVGINLHRLPLEKVNRGLLVAQPGVLSSTFFLNVDLHLLQNAKNPIKNKQRVKLYLGTSVTNALVALMEGELIQPGERALAQLRLANPVPAFPQDPFVLCPLNVQTVIAGGAVLEISREKYRTVKGNVIFPYLDALRHADLKAFIDCFLASNPKHPFTAEDLAMRTGFPPSEVAGEIRLKIKAGELLDLGVHGVFSKAQYIEIKKNLPKVAEGILLRDPLKRILNPDEIKHQLGPFSDAIPVRRMIEELCREGKLLKLNGGFQVTNFSVQLPPEKTKLAALLLDYANEAGFAPFSADSVWKFQCQKHNKSEIEKLLLYLCHQKRLVRLSDGRFLLSQAAEEVKERVKRVISERGVFTLDDIRETLGYGRRIGVIVLEYLDAIGFTKREGNARTLHT